MARPLRVQFAGAWYHVMNRGGSGRRVFPDKADAAAFHALLEEISEQFGIECHAYCLMGTHYHLLLRTTQPNLSRGMRHLDGVFTQRFHKRHGTDGALFRGRYRAILVQADRHLLAVSRYIHLNPVEAGLVARPEDWPYSSYHGYLDWAAATPWLHTRSVLACFGNIGARIRYRRYVEEGIDPGTRDFYGRPRLSPVLGDDGFRERVRGDLGAVSDEARRELAGLRTLSRPVPLGRIAEAVASAFGVASVRPDERGASSRTRSALARGAFVLAARRLGGWPLRAIAAYLGYRSYDAAWRAAARFRERASRDPSLPGTLDDLVASLANEAIARAYPGSPTRARTRRSVGFESDVET